MTAIAASSLDPRLAAVADFVRPGSRVADIGTDHGHVVAHLINSGKCPFAIAADINRGPLEAARANLVGLPPGSVELIQSDGLAGISPSDTDDIIIAGMGGELIARILADAPDFHRADKRLILQPMTRAHKLRAFLCEAGFAIREERPVFSAGRPYTVMLCAFTGEPLPADPVFCCIGRLPLPPDAAGRALLTNMQKDLLNQRAGIGRANPDMARETDTLLSAIDIALNGGDPYGP